ncbi:MAG TPA: helix-hairpin-helix domain-containing protein [Thiothrix sp.]|nr:helix-hairpin-helix domain-containing protein [Thiothrix sp.]
MFKKLLLSSIIAILLLTSAFAATVNINQADIVTLAENLKGIGMKKAKAIVDYREANGDFNTIDDIVNVKGIGAKTLQKNRESLSVGESKSDADVTEETQSNEATDKKEKQEVKKEVTKDTSKSKE